MAKSPYDILGILDTATQDEVKDAYRGLAKKHHPDMGGGVDGFLAIKQAYELLSDPKRRKVYDKLHGVVQQSKKSQQTQQTQRPSSGSMGFSSGSYMNTGAFQQAARNFWGSPVVAQFIAGGGRYSGSTYVGIPLTNRMVRIQRNMILALNLQPQSFGQYGPVTRTTIGMTVVLDFISLSQGGNVILPGDTIEAEYVGAGGQTGVVEMVAEKVSYQYNSGIPVIEIEAVR